jgi:uncharacterized RDD family membrane protein YckC
LNLGKEGFLVNDSAHPHAGFWRRFAASLIDWAVIAFVMVQFRSLWWGQMIVSIENYEAVNQILSILVSLMSFIFAWVYFSGMESSPLRATVGKLAVGLYVTDLEGQRITFERATGRYFGKILSGLILCMGYVMAGFTEEKQGLHDFLARCYVLRK